MSQIIVINKIDEAIPEKGVWHDYYGDIFVSVIPIFKSAYIRRKSKIRNNRRNYRVKQYGTTKCDQCKLRDKCTTSPSGRKIERPNHQPNVERNNSRIARYGYYYRLSQQIVEPVFGVLKRQWHFDHVIHKGRSKVEMEVSVAMFTYNLMRLVQIKGQEWVKKTLKDLILLHNWHYTQYSDWWMSMWKRWAIKKGSSYQAA